jgi:hypothetical protein
MRIARCITHGALYHVISRFSDHRWFFEHEEERARYLHLFSRAIARTDWLSVSYALMSNHIHHALIAGEDSLESIFKACHSPFANWMNSRHGRIGPVFADRAAAWLVRPEHAGRLIAYIHNNPVRAGVVAHASHSAWTSYRAIAGLAQAPTWLGVDRARELAPQLDCDVDLEEDDEGLPGIHKAARKRGAIELGTPEAGTGTVRLVVRRYARVFHDPLEVVKLVAALTNVDAPRVRSRSTERSACSARRIAVHVGVALGLGASAMGTALGISRQAASKLSLKRLSDDEEALVYLAVVRLTELTPSPDKLLKSAAA